MKAIDILKAFDGSGVDSSEWQIIETPAEFDTTAAEWVNWMFGGDLQAGAVAPDTEYIAVWSDSDYNEPRFDGAHDAIVSNEGGTFIYLYELEK